MNRSSPEVDDGGGFADTEPESAELAALLSSAPRFAPRRGAAGAAACVGRAELLLTSAFLESDSSKDVASPLVIDVVSGVAEEEGVEDAIARSNGAARTHRDWWIRLITCVGRRMH